MRNFFRRLHLWLSIPLGIVMTITCFTGAMLVFEDEITAMCTSETRTVRAGCTPLPINVLAEKVADTLPEGVSITGVVVSSDPEKAYKVNLSKPRRAALYVDQYTGEVKGKAERLPFFNVMFRMHRWLMDSSPENGGIFWGKMVVGVSTLLFVALLLTGLVIWFPRNRKALKNRLGIALTKGWKRFWYDLHVAGGFYASLLLLAMALTGLTWSFQWYRTGFYNLLGVETVQGRGRDSVSYKQHNVSGSESVYRCWQQAFDNVAALNPDYSQITVTGGSVSVSDGGCGNSRAADKYTFDTSTGRIISVLPYKNSAPAGKISGWIYSVHVGSWGGTITRILTFFAAILGASLPLTGYYLYIKRVFFRKGRKGL